MATAPGKSATPTTVTLKHLAAAAAGLVVCWMLMKRELRQATPKGDLAAAPASERSSLGSSFDTL